MEELNVEEFIKSQPQHHIDIREYSDEDTYAIHDLKTAAQKSLLWKFMVSLGIPNEQVAKQKLYYYFNGRCLSLPNTSVFYCRGKMQPAKWYYKINETLPEKIEFNPKHDISEMLSLESLGHQKLFKMVKDMSIPRFAEYYDVSIFTLKNMLYKRMNKLTGTMCFKALPNESFILKMRDEINPDIWYIYPDEVS